MLSACRRCWSSGARGSPRCATAIDELSLDGPDAIDGPAACRDPAPCAFSSHAIGYGVEQPGWRSGQRTCDRPPGPRRARFTSSRSSSPVASRSGWTMASSVESGTPRGWATSRPDTTRGWSATSRCTFSTSPEACRRDRKWPREHERFVTTLLHDRYSSTRPAPRAGLVTRPGQQLLSRSTTCSSARSSSAWA